MAELKQGGNAQHSSAQTVEEQKETAVYLWHTDREGYAGVSSSKHNKPNQGKPHCHCHILESLDEQAAQQPTNVHLGEEDEVDGVRLCQQPHQRVVAVPPKQKSPEISVERKKLTHISLARLTLVLAKKPQPGLSSTVEDLRMNSYHTKLLHLQITL
uniref:Uncharacterized protein n=1 Tax=Oryza meridionalis TaxID=40149 RepID=A0A0E0EK23_9ORYZ